MKCIGITLICFALQYPSPAFSQDTNEPVEKVITGIVRGHPSMLIPPSKRVEQEQLLALYRVKPEDFSYRMEVMSRTGVYDTYKVSFPSAFISGIPENNTVHCEYFTPLGNTKRPGVVILDIMDGSMIISRLIAHVLATNGIDAAIMTLPHYGERRSPDASRRAKLTESIDEFIAAVHQAVIDVRRSAQWLADRPLVDADRIGLCGTSMGGFVAALATGVDGKVPRTALVLAGGDLATVLSTDAKEVSSMKAKLVAEGITIDVLRKRLESIEPLTFADRMQSTKILMINGITDKIVPAQCASQLANPTGAQIHWYKTDHYGMVKNILPILSKVTEHFSEQSW